MVARLALANGNKEQSSYYLAMASCTAAKPPRTPKGGQPAPKKSGPVQALAEWAEMIKVEHTVFALPFALSGMVLAQTQPPSWQVVFFIILAFAGARSAAMTLNRIIDAKIDLKNPRTTTRAIPAGRISMSQACALAVVSFVVMLYAASKLPAICLTLSPIAIFWLSFYSFTKRFTWACHLALGIALGGAALGGWVAAGGQLNTLAPWILALAVATWVAGFDIIYASQDIDFDNKENLHSIPARFGLAKALNISSGLHVVTIAALSLLGWVLNLGFIYWMGVTMVAMMLAYEHHLVSPKDLSKVNAAFFNINGVVSILAFITILLDKLFS